jgi:predicted dehydrogenase
MKNNKIARRDLLKAGGVLAMQAPFVRSAMAQTNKSRPMTAIVLGAGNRGNTYSGYSTKFPKELKIIGVAEPIEFRRKRFAQKYNIPADRQWTTWEHVMEYSKLADVLIITTPDALHHGPALAGLDLGYDLLLEKAIGRNWSEVNDILQKTKKHQKIVGICHVLRYTNYFRNLKNVMDSGVLGELLSFEHTEKLGLRHYSHSYIRGNWRTSKEAAPMLLAKSCHDLDILRWLIGKPCKYVSSFGSQTLFVEEKAPKGSAKRCTDCRIEKECHWSALKHYYRDKERLNHLAIENHDEKSIYKALQKGPFGRCVWFSDNDTVDHQVVNMEFKDNITASFTLGFSPFPGRRTRINGPLATIVGDLEKGFTVTKLGTGESTRYKNEIPKEFDSGHGGGDYGLVHDFLRAVRSQDPSLLTSKIEESVESHLMGYTAEDSRKSRETLRVNMAAYM